MMKFQTLTYNRYSIKKCRPPFEKKVFYARTIQTYSVYKYYDKIKPPRFHPVYLWARVVQHSCGLEVVYEHCCYHQYSSWYKQIFKIIFPVENCLVVAQNNLFTSAWNDKIYIDIHTGRSRRVCKIKNNRNPHLNASINEVAFTTFQTRGKRTNVTTTFSYRHGTTDYYWSAEVHRAFRYFTKWWIISDRMRL